MQGFWWLHLCAVQKGWCCIRQSGCSWWHFSSPEEPKYTQECILRWMKGVDLILDISALFSKECFNFILKISTSFSIWIIKNVFWLFLFLKVALMTIKIDWCYILILRTRNCIKVFISHENKKDHYSQLQENVKGQQTTHTYIYMNGMCQYNQAFALNIHEPNFSYNLFSVSAHS